MTPSLQTFGTSVLMVLSAILVSAQVVGQPSIQQSTDVPQGWYVYPDEELKSATASDRRCFNYSRREWRVTVEDGEAQVADRRKVQDEIPALPPRLVHQQGMTGLRSATRFNDEWLLAYDGGEFGGGLWLTNEDGSEAKRIFNSDVQAVIALEKGVLILSGLDHMGLDVGNALLYSAPHEMHMALQESLKLDGAPSAFAQETDGSVLFVTTHSLCKIRTVENPAHIAEMDCTTISQFHAHNSRWQHLRWNADVRFEARRQRRRIQRRMAASQRLPGILLGRDQSRLRLYTVTSGC